MHALFSCCAHSRRICRKPSVTLERAPHFWIKSSGSNAFVQDCFTYCCFQICIAIHHGFQRRPLGRQPLFACSATATRQSTRRQYSTGAVFEFMHCTWTVQYYSTSSAAALVLTDLAIQLRRAGRRAGFFKNSKRIQKKNRLCDLGLP